MKTEMRRARTRQGERKEGETGNNQREKLREEKKKRSASALPQFPMKLISVPPKDLWLPSPPSLSPRLHYTPVPLDE